MQELHDLTLTMRGLKHDEEFSYYEEQRANFPSKIIDKAMVPRVNERVRVEPGVRMNMPYITGIPSSYKIILARANFYYAHREVVNRPRHGAEQTFRVGAAQRA